MHLILEMFLYLEKQKYAGNGLVVKKQESIPLGCVPPTSYRTGRVSVTENP